MHSYGWVRDSLDPRDYQGFLSVEERKIALPSSADLRPLMPPVYDQGQLGCHDEKTEVLTDIGWMDWSDYSGSEMLGTINPATGALEFQAPIALHKYDYTGPLYKANHKRLDFAITPNHRMWVRRWDERKRTLSDEYSMVEADKLGWYFGLQANPTGYVGTELKRLAVGSREYDGDDFLALISLIASDGWVGGTESNRNTLSFCCFRHDRRDMVAALAQRLGLNELPGRTGVWRWSDAALANWVRANLFIGDIFRSSQKHIPLLVQSASQRQIAHFLSFYGDQHISKRDRMRQFYSSSHAMIDDLQTLLLKTGKRSSVYERDPRSTQMSDGRIIKAENCGPDITLSEARKYNLSMERKENLTTEDYSGQVFCASVPNGLLVTRRNRSVLISGNSCTANAIAGALEYQEWKQAEKTGTPSRLFIYYNEREMEGTVNSDSGAMIRDGIKSVATQGAPDETDWPYDIAKFKQKPPTLAYQDALQHVAVTYARPRRTSYYLRLALANNHPIVFGFTVYESFESDAVASTGWVPMPDPATEQILGGHAVCAVGYFYHNGHLYFIVRNSWGTGWGDSGYCYFPASILLDTDMSNDFWTIKVVS